MEKPDDLSDCESVSRTDVSAVLVVTDMPVFPSSVVTECFDDVTLVKAPPATKRSMMPPTPQQRPCSGKRMEAQGSIWSDRERTVIPKTEIQLDRSDDMNLEVGELESF